MIKRISIESLAGFLFSGRAKERTLAILDCWMDESSDKTGAVLFSVGAVIGTVEKWQWIESEWRTVLKQEGLKYFRANDCAALTGQFLKFRSNRHKVTPAEKRKAESVRHKLLEIIGDSRVTGVGMSIDMAAFRAAANTPEKLEAFGGTPYYHCYFLAMALCAELIKEHRPGDSVAYGFDDHQEYGAHLRNVFEDFKKVNPKIAPHMTTIASFDDKLVVALQVADLIASIVRKFNLWTIAKPRPSRPYEMRVLERNHIMGIMRLCGKPCLDAFLKDKGF
jgi:hypothetical protein